MSTCISLHGEYSDHVLTTEPDERFICQRCFAFDEDAAIKAVTKSEGALAVAGADALYRLAQWLDDAGPLNTADVITVEFLRRNADRLRRGESFGSMREEGST